MADTVIAASLTLDGSQATKTVKSFKTELREAGENLINIQKTFGQTSPEALKAAKAVAELKDQMKSAQELTDAFNPDQKFNALNNAIRTTAGGFSALTGIMGLFGTEGDDIQKTILKVQSALAITEGLNNIGEIKKSFQQLGGVISDVASKAFGSLKAAIITSGIGALAIALGYVIANWQSISEAISGVSRNTKLLNEINQKAIESYAEEKSQIDVVVAQLNDENISRKNKLSLIKELQDKYPGYFDNIKTEGDLNTKLAADYKNVTTALLEKAKAQAAQDLIAQNEKKILDAQLKVQQTLNDEQTKNNVIISSGAQGWEHYKKVVTEGNAGVIKSLQADNDFLIKQITTTSEKIDKAGGTLGKGSSEAVKSNLLQVIQQETDIAIQRAKIEGKSEDDIQKIREDGLMRQIAAAKDNAEQQMDLQNQLILSRLQYQEQLTKIDLDAYEKRRQSQLDNNVITFQDMQADVDARAEADQKAQDATVEREKKSVADRLPSLQAWSDAVLQAANQQKKIDSSVAENKIATLLAIEGALNAFTQLIGQQTLAGKVLGIATATINTYIGATEVLRAKSLLPEPFGTISKIANVAAVIATGLTAVKNIVKTPVPGKGGGGSAPSMSLGPTGAPLSPQIPVIQTTQLPKDQINQQGNAAIPAYVIESDITSSQEKIVRTNRAARLGG